MPSIYNNTSNIYRSDFRSITLTDSGTFSFPSEIAKKVAIFNDSTTVVRVYKTENLTGDAFSSTISGTSNVDGVYITLEDGVSYDVFGIGNTSHISVQKKFYNDPVNPFVVRYIVER
jgi:hypothetical protein